MKIVNALLMLLPSMLPATLPADQVGDFAPLGVGYEWTYKQSGSLSDIKEPFTIYAKDTGIVRVKILAKEVRGDSIIYTGQFLDSVHYQYVAPGYESRYHDYVEGSELKLLDGVSDTIRVISGNIHYSIPMMFGPHHYPESAITGAAQTVTYNLNGGMSAHAKDIGMQHCWNGYSSSSDAMSLVQFTRNADAISMRKKPVAGNPKAGSRKSPYLFRYGNRDLSILGRLW